MSDGGSQQRAPEALVLLQLERDQLAADLDAIESDREPWIRPQEVAELRERLGAIERLIANTALPKTTH